MRNTVGWHALWLGAILPIAASAQTCNTSDRSVALILDASGSMGAKLATGETRMMAAQKAIKGAAAVVDPKAQVALRVYGAKPVAREKSCQDSHLAVPFGSAQQQVAAIDKAVDEVKPQGWTPLAYSLEQAGNDFPAAARERAIVLVSDGKETCQGDPVVAAKALAAKGITIHTIGFVVDTAARMQLEGVARATGGKYFDAPDGALLAGTLRSALNACKEKVQPRANKPGKLRTTASEWLKAHEILNAETGQKVGALSHTQREMALPAGIYEVRFGAASWKGIEVRDGETTTIAPGTIRVKGLSMLSSMYVFDTETGVQHASLNANNTSAVLLPGIYDVGAKQGARWRFVKVDSDAIVELQPAVVRAGRSLGQKDKVRVLLDGKQVESLNSAKQKVSLPPGDYVIEVNGEKTPFAAAAGDEFVVK